MYIKKRYTKREIVQKTLIVQKTHIGSLYVRFMRSLMYEFFMRFMYGFYGRVLRFMFYDVLCFMAFAYVFAYEWVLCVRL